MNDKGFFTELANTRPFLKMAFEGFAGSGKSFTASQVAIGLHRAIGSTKPVAVFDTERAFKALKPLFDKAGIRVLHRENSRSLADLQHAIELCVGGAADILIIDSITHVWESFLETYKEAINREADEKRRKRRLRLEFQDWGILKPQWKKGFSDSVVQSPVHIIFTGRAGFEYAKEENERGEKELVVTGIKMKAEGETPYEPDLLVMMEIVKEMEGKRMKVISNRATILKDRTDSIMGHEFVDPTFESFKPAIDVLLAGVVGGPRTTSETKDEFDVDDEGHDRAKLTRTILLEKIEAAMVALCPGQSAKEKALKVGILAAAFNTTSWKEVTVSKFEVLNKGLEYLTMLTALVQPGQAEGIEIDWPRLMAQVTEQQKEVLPFDEHKAPAVAVSGVPATPPATGTVETGAVVPPLAGESSGREPDHEADPQVEEFERELHRRGIRREELPEFETATQALQYVKLLLEPDQVRTIEATLQGASLGEGRLALCAADQFMTLMQEANRLSQSGGKGKRRA